MPVQLPDDQIYTTVDSLPLVLTGGDPAGVIHELSLGLVTVTQDPNDGHVQNISLNGLLAGAGLDYEDSTHQSAPPAQLDGEVVNTSASNGFSGTDLSGISLTGPAQLEANYADGSDSGQFPVVVGEDSGPLHGVLLDGSGDRELDSVEIGGVGSFGDAGDMLSLAGDLLNLTDAIHI